MNRLSVRLGLAFLLLTWLSIGAVAVILHDTLEGGFREYLRGQEAARLPAELPAKLTAYFAQAQGWAGAESLFPGAGRGNNGAGHGGGNQGRQYFVVDTARVIVASSDAARVGASLTTDDLDEALPLRLDGRHIGWLAWQTPGQQRFGAAEQAFLDDMTGALLGVAGVAGALALVLGGGLAWGLTRPLGHLTRAVQTLSAGERGQQVTPEGTQEIRQLATAFNELSDALDRSERAQGRIAADVAHELRTPVTVLRGQLEGMLDDVVALDKASIALAYDQTLHLKRLIEDLRLLTLAEVKQLPLETRPVEITAFLENLIAAFDPLALDAGLTLRGDFPPQRHTIQADEGRLMQIFGNLLTNALRHTSAEGTITISAQVEPAQVTFHVRNTGAGLSAEDAARLFDPFWRADDARDRERGGSGLGLAIAKGLVECHGGTIQVAVNADETAFIIQWTLL